MADDGRKIIARNRRARHEYEVLDTVEAGIALLGPEVKSLREGRANMGDAFAYFRRGECYLGKLHISPYEPATRDNPDNPQRERKLLLHRQQIERLSSRVAERGLTLVPLSLYWKDGRAKIELALVRGKRLRDKREDLKRREADRDAERAMRDRGGRGRR
ncbi:MAG: SsrA-binding protein SmpB [Deltaproteobacteria bacterium]|jgi:SsrA-binding protein|nr:SsrA-binding protein SmpB [Deltaproteobacteria bacterium]